MSKAVGWVEKAIADLELEREKISAAILQLRATVASFKDEDIPASAPSKDTLPFTKKYEQSAGELVLNVVGESKRPASVGGIREALAERGFQFPARTVALTVTRLHKAGKLRRVRAAAGSGFNYAYALPLEQPSLDLGAR